jgi:hypothetical protein
VTFQNWTEYQLHNHIRTVASSSVLYLMLFSLAPPSLTATWWDKIVHGNDSVRAILAQAFQARFHHCFFHQQGYRFARPVTIEAQTARYQ